MSGNLFAQPPAQPVIKNGSCPSGYVSSGNYCVPSGDSSRFAITKSGSCPSGYVSSGDYCLASGDNSRQAISLNKGGNLSLSKTDPNLNNVLIGLSWDATPTDGKNFDLDLDASASYHLNLPQSSV